MTTSRPQQVDLSQFNRAMRRHIAKTNKVKMPPGKQDKTPDQIKKEQYRKE